MSGQPARLVLELQKCLTFFPIFKLKCGKNHYIAKSNTTTQSDDTTAMFVTAATLVRRWDRQGLESAMKRNADLMIYSFRYAVCLSHLNEAGQKADRDARLDRQPCTFGNSTKRMYVPKLIMADFVNAVDEMTAVYNRQVAEGKQVGQLFANMQIGEGHTEEIEGLEATLAARHATILQLQGELAQTQSKGQNENLQAFITAQDATIRQLQTELAQKNVPAPNNSASGDNDAPQPGITQQQLQQVQDQLNGRTERVRNQMGRCTACEAKWIYFETCRGCPSLSGRLSNGKAVESHGHIASVFSNAVTETPERRVF